LRAGTRGLYLDPGITCGSMSKQDQDLSGKLVKVAYAKGRAEAGMIQGLLDNAGIPSILRDLGVDGPQLGFGVLVKNPQHVMVRADQAEQARALLAETLVEDQQAARQVVGDTDYLGEAGGRRPRGYGLVGAYARSYLWALAVFAVVFAIFMLLRAT
jgi:Putative prokaryotic signal transducing protein